MMKCRKGHLVSVRANRNAKSSSQTKVGQLERTDTVDKQILRLQVAMQHPVGVAESNTFQQLLHVGLNEAEKEKRERHRHSES